jgi:hypothetical protein
MVFEKKLNYDVIKIAKTVRIFVEIEHIKTGGSHFGPKELDKYFPCYGAVTTLVRNFDQSCNHSIVWEILVQ